MCLAVNKTQRVKVAKEDIICYKVVRRYKKVDHNEYETPYRDQPIELGGFYDESDNLMDIEYACGALDDWDGDTYKSVRGNAFHSFANLKDAKWEARDWGYYKEKGVEDMIVVECIIPKGARYYKGINAIYNAEIAGYPDGYASNKIIYTSTIYEV